MAGVNRQTGVPMAEAEHIRQSIADILTTPVGTRVMRRRYGSHLFDLVDAPGNAAGSLRMIAATADALARWEPRVELRSAVVSPAMDGRAAIHLDCVVLASGSPLEADVLVGGGA